MNDTAHEWHIPELTLGWRLKMGLALGRMTSQDMAKALEISRTTVSRWMAGRGTPPKSVYVKQWALITGTDVQWLLNGQQDAPHPAGLDEGRCAECAVRELNPQPAGSETAAWTELAKVLPFERRRRVQPTTTPAIAVPEAA